MIVLTVFATVILPIFLIVTLGMVLQRLKRVPIQPLSQTVLYVLSPALVFNGLATTELALEHMGRITAFALLLVAALYAISRPVAAVLRLDREAQSAFLMSVLFMNSGNLGLSLVLLAFGQEGLERAIIFFATQALLSTTLGVFLASRGRSGVGASLRSVVTMPLPYAAALGVLTNVLDIPVPVPVMRAAGLLAGATIPAMLLVLGFQLVVHGAVEEWRAVTASAVLRLVVSAAVAAAIMWALGLDDLSRKALLVQAAAPTAVIITILATEFNARPGLATSTVLVSTAASLVTLTLLLTYLAR